MWPLWPRIAESHNGRSTSGLLPTLDDAHDRQGLGRKRTPLQLLQRWPDRIVRTMQGRKTSKYMLAQRRTVHTEVIRDRCGCSHKSNSFRRKRPKGRGKHVFERRRAWRRDDWRFLSGLLEAAQDGARIAGTSAEIAMAFRRKPWLRIRSSRSFV